MITQHSLADLLDLAIENELKAQKLYRKLQSLFDYIPDLKSFFKIMEKDEATHARFIRGIKKDLSEEEINSKVTHAEWNRVAEMSRELSAAAEITIATLDDAFELSHELEASEINYFLVEILGRYILDEENRHQIVNKVIDHQEKIMTLSQITGDKSERTKVLARPM